MASAKVKVAAPDGGWGWVCAVGSIVCFFILGGIPMSFSLIFQALREKYECSATQASWVYALYSIVGMTSGPFVTPFCQRFSCRAVVMTGGVSMATGLIICSQAPNLSVVYFGFGFLSALGASMISNGTFITINTYFHKKRSRALAICMLGDGIGGLVLAPLIISTMRQYGYPGTMIVIAGMALQTTVVGALFRPLVIAKTDKSPPKPNKQNKIYNPKNGTKTSIVHRDVTYTNVDTSYSLPEKGMLGLKYIDDEANSGDEYAIDEEESNSQIKARHKSSESEDTAYQSLATGSPEKIPSEEGSAGNNSHSDIEIGYLNELQDRTKRLSNDNLQEVETPGINVQTPLTDISRLEGDGDCVHKITDSETKTSRCERFGKVFLKYIDLRLLSDPKFACMCLMVGCVAITNGVGNMYLAGFSSSRGLSVPEISTLMSIRAGTFLAAKILSGFIFDSKLVRHRKLVVYSLIGFFAALLNLAVPLTVDIVSVFIVWICVSILICWLMTQESGVICDIVTIHRFPSALGITRFFRGLVAFTGSLIMGKLSDITGSYDMAFIFAGCLVLLGTSLVQAVNLRAYFKARKEKHAEQQQEQTTAAV